MADIIQMRRDTAANWTSANPILADGELGMERDTKRFKMGDGTTHWNDLAYYERSQVINDLTTGGATDVLSAQQGVVLKGLIDAGFKYGGKLTPGAAAQTPNCKIFFVADGAGTYTNYNNLVVAENELVILKYDLSAWSKETLVVFSDVTAGDITPKSTEPKEAVSLMTIQTTGGSEDIKSGDANFVGVRGTLSDSLVPFLADKFVSTGMNLVDPTKYFALSSNKAYFFPVKKGVWGNYGTTDENNGYIVVGTAPVGVYFSATRPTASSYGSACPTQTSHGKTYYLPGSDGWLVVVMSGNTVPACHIVWSNKSDAEAGVFGNTEKDINAAVQAVHTWGLAGLVGIERSVFDELDFKAGKSYKRIDRSLLSGLTWTMTTETSETEGGGTTTTYIFTATISAMKSNGLWKAGYAGITLSGKTIEIRSTTITTVAALQTALGSAYIYYELASVVQATISGAAALMANTVNDMGLSYFLYDGELVSVPAYVTEEFYQGGKDQLFNNINRVSLIEEIIADVFNNFEQRLESLSEKFGVELTDIIAMGFTKNWRHQKNFMDAFILKVDGSPITANIEPEYRGQFAEDETNGILYRAFGVTVASWKPLNS